MSIKLKEGKRYVNRHGWISPPLKIRRHHTHPYWIPGRSWNEYGFEEHKNSPGDEDLISEYHDPTPAGWILCKDRMPTEADGNENGFVLCLRTDGLWTTYRWGEVCIRSVHRWLPIPKFTPPAPEKKKVALGPEDVPLLCQIKHLGKCPHGAVVTTKNDDAVFAPGCRWVPYTDLLDSEFEISRDGGKTWERCYKEVDA